MASLRISSVIFILLALNLHNANAINEIVNDDIKSIIQSNNTNINDNVISSTLTTAQSSSTSSTEHYPPFPINDRNDNFGKR